MNFRLIANTTSYVLWVEAGFLLLPLLVSVLYGEPWMPFFATAVLCILIGFILQLVPVKKAQMHSRDGFMVVALGWIALSLTGALPYVFSGALNDYVDAIFETVSGLTTTGSTVFPEVEHLHRSVLLWRSLTQWMGGMGVLVLFLALMPKLGDGAVYLMRAESPGPIKSKLVPKVGSTAKILYTIYLALTALEMLCLRLAGLTWFSAVNHAFTTMATGGFSINNTSLSGSSPAVMWIVTIFSFLAGVNFSLLFLAVTGKLRAALHSEELRVYTAVVVGMTLLICLCLRLQAGIPLSGSITDAAFQTVTIITTTGFATVDFAMWPTFCRMALLVLMFSGGCAGSTAGGMKVSRVLILWKSLVRELKRATGLPAAASFKHVSPAGAAVGLPLSDVLRRIYFIAPDADLSPLACAYARARGADRMSSFGDWISLSDVCDVSTAKLIKPEVSDGVIAPGYEPEALEILKSKRKGNYNIVKIDPDYVPEETERKQVYGITFEQGRNNFKINRELLTNIVTENKDLPDSAARDLIISLITLKYTQSNSVCYAVDGQAIGVGAGQQSRIHCTRLAGTKADTWFLRQHEKVLNLPFKDSIGRPDRDNVIDGYINRNEEDVCAEGNWQKYFTSRPEPLTDEEIKAYLASIDGVSLGSDAFFPFGDNIERAKRSGVKYIAEPGGSIRDDLVIECCDKYGMVMAFTGMRLFHH